MRLNSIDISSFGRLKSRRFQLNDGFNVFYGPNESGKTTAMEFIRSTLVPDTKSKKQYPARAKDNSGTIIVSDGGVNKEIRLEYRSRSGDVPETISEMDPKMYRSIYAMKANDLELDDDFFKDTIRPQFFTVSGGSRIPDLMSSMENERSAIVGKNSSSNCKVLVCSRAISEKEVEIERLRSNSERYAELKHAKEDLESKAEDMREEKKKALESNRLYDSVQTVRPMYECLRKKEAELDEMKQKPMVSDEAVAKYEALKENRSASMNMFQSLDEKRNRCLDKLPMKNEDSLKPLLPRIEEVLGNRDNYKRKKAEPTERSVVKQKSAVMYLPGIALLVAGLIPVLLSIENAMVITAAIEVLAVAALVFAFIKKPKTVIVKCDPDPWISSYEKEVSELAIRCGYDRADAEFGLRNLSVVANVMRNIGVMADDWNNWHIKMLEADGNLSRFLSSYGGLEGYQNALENTKAVVKLETEINQLDCNIRSAGFVPSEPLPTIEKVEFDDDELSELEKNIFSLENEMRSAMDTAALDRNTDALFSLKAEMTRLLRDGAVAILSGAILDDACDNAYKTVHPAVIEDANRYLSEMTSDKYRFDLNPALDSLTVIDGEGISKDSKAWSTGLTAQIQLSLKLAIAKEMGKGEVPVILDDVLLVFDSMRKEGACRALSEISKEMQILMFTCDSEVKTIVSGIEGVNLIEM